MLDARVLKYNFKENPIGIMGALISTLNATPRVRKSLTTMSHFPDKFFHLMPLLEFRRPRNHPQPDYHIRPKRFSKSRSLPEAASPRGRTIGIRAVNLAYAVGPPRATAAEEDNEGREEQDDHGGQNGPHAHAVIGMAARAIAVDVVLDNAGPHEICCHDDERDDECDG